VLFVGDPLIGRFYSEAIPEITWHTAHSSEQAFDLLAREAVDFLLLDLAMRPLTPGGHDGLPTAFHDVSAPVASDKTLAPFDHGPLAARHFAAGQQLLEQLHTRMPEVPVYLFSLEDAAGDILRKSIDDELFLACVRAGGARGAVRTSLGGDGTKQWEEERDRLKNDLEAIARRLQRERLADELARQSNVVTFDTAPTLSGDGRQLTVRCRNFRTVRTVRSSDVGSVVSDVERPTTTFADVIGAVGAKEALTFIRNWLREPKRYAAAGVDPPRGVLLTGHPGTGKTMLARALAGESECAFLAESATSFVTMWQGSGPQNVRDLFARARRYAPSVVFIDEIDAIGKTRVGTVGAGRAQEETLNALLVEMDGFSQSTSVIVLAATNHPELLDPALKRRFNREIEVELPTRAERTLYLSRRLQSKAKHEVSAEMLNRIAAQSAGRSIADLEGILNQAAVMAFGNSGVITDAILGEAFEKVTMGEAKAGTDPLRTARHEAGHALLMCLTGKPPIYVTTVGRGSFGGYAAFEDTDERRSQTKPELEDLICQMLGGREAERLYYGDGLGESTGPSNDLEQATRLAEAMVCDFGMADEVGFVRIDRERPLPGEIAVSCHAAMRRIIDAQSQRAAQMLAEHRQTLDGIVAALIDRNRLLREELLALLDPEERAVAERPYGG
jgi:ATP-dependent metalloprotease FtsH